MKNEDGLLGMLGNLMQGPKNKTIPQHYGMNDEDASKIIGEIVGLILFNGSKPAVLDQLFPNLDATDRVKVELYHEARNLLENNED